MAIPLAMEPHGSYPASSSVLLGHKSLKEKSKSIKEIICSPKTKAIANYAANGTASAFAFLTFLSANLNLFDSFQEKLDYASEKLERFGNAVSGLIGAVDLGQKRNLLPCLGYVSMIPISTFINGYNNWLARGVSIALNFYAFIIDRREVVDESGEPTKDKDGKVQYLDADFSDEGWLEGLKVSLVESKKMIKELYDKPKRVTKFSHATLLTSIGQMLGPIVHVLGLKQTGSFIRNTAGIAGYAALLLDRRAKGKTFLGMNLKSPIVQCSLLRIGTSIFDQMKQFDYFSSRIKNLTDISLALDRLAGLRFTKGIFDINKKVNSR